MSKTERKRQLLTTQPNCPKCGLKLVVSPATKGRKKSMLCQEAVLVGEGLICFQCHRLACKEVEINNLPWRSRWKKKLDRLTGIPSTIRFYRKILGQYIYFKKGNKPNGRPPAWLKDIN